MDKQVSKQKNTFTVISILVLTSFAFLLSNCAVQKENSAGSINGKYINKQDFVSSARGHFTGFVLEKDRTPDELEKKEIGRKTWRDITIHVILKDYFKKYQIQVTQQEVLDTLLNNIPASIKKAPMFIEKGEFVQAKYVSTLLDPKETRLDWLKNHYFQYYIPLAKLKHELQRKEVISKANLSKLEKVMNSQAEISWIVFDPATIPVKVNQSEVENYYQSRISSYELKSYASFGWTVIPVSADEGDAEIAKDKIDSLSTELSRGVPFAKLAEKYSSASTSHSGGAMGFIKTDQLTPEVRSLIEMLDKNQISRPIRQKDSWVIYELVERTKSMVKLNELVIAITPGSVARNTVKAKAVNLRDLALQMGLQTACSEMDYTYQTSGIVSRDSIWLPDPNLCPYLIDRAFAPKSGKLLEPVYSKTMQAWILAEVLEAQPNQHQPLIQVNDEIALILTKQKQLAYMTENAANWSELHHKNALSAAHSEHLEVISQPGMTVLGTVLGTPVNSIFVQVLTDYYSGTAPKPQVVGEKVLVPIVSEIQEINPAQFSEQDVRQYYFTYLNPGWFDKWLEDEIAKAKVNIWFSYP